MQTIKKFTYELLSQGDIWLDNILTEQFPQNLRPVFSAGGGPRWPALIATAALYNVYLQYCKDTDVDLPHQPPHFGKYFRQCLTLPASNKRSLSHRGRRYRTYLLPPLDKCRGNFIANTKVQVQWPDNYEPWQGYNSLLNHFQIAQLTSDPAAMAELERLEQELDEAEEYLKSTGRSVADGHDSILSILDAD